MRRLPLRERKERLRESFENTSNLIYASEIEGAGAWVFGQAKALGLEGMVTIRMDSSYLGPSVQGVEDELVRLAAEFGLAGWLLRARGFPSARKTPLFRTGALRR